MYTHINKCIHNSSLNISELEKQCIIQVCSQSVKNNTFIEDLMLESLSIITPIKYMHRYDSLVFIFQYASHVFCVLKHGELHQ